MEKVLLATNEQAVVDRDGILFFRNPLGDERVVCGGWNDEPYAVRRDRWLQAARLKWGFIKVLGADGGEGPTIPDGSMPKLHYVKGDHVYVLDDATANSNPEGHNQYTNNPVHEEEAKGIVARLESKIMGQFERLPGFLKTPIKLVLKVLYAGWIAGHKAVHAVCKAKGMTDEQAEKTANLCSLADGIAAKAAAPAIALGVPASIEMAPIASVGYLAVSTALHPMATLRAAQSVVKAYAEGFTRMLRDEGKATIKTHNANPEGHNQYTGKKRAGFKVIEGVDDVKKAPDHEFTGTYHVHLSNGEVHPIFHDRAVFGGMWMHGNHVTDSDRTRAWISTEKNEVLPKLLAGGYTPNKETT